MLLGTAGGFLRVACARRPPCSFAFSISDERANLPRKGPIAFAAHLRLQRRAEARGAFVAVRCKIPSKNDILIPTAASLWMRSFNSTEMFQLRWHLFASGRTHSFPSTASQRISFPSSLPISPPRRTAFVPLPCAVIGAEPS